MTDFPRFDALRREVKRHRGIALFVSTRRRRSGMPALEIRRWTAGAETSEVLARFDDAAMALAWLRSEFSSK